MPSPDVHTAPAEPAIIDTDPSSSFGCDYVAGVNRVLSLPPYLLIDNIGRNVEVWHVPPGVRDPVARARYDLTSYAGDPAASLLDVDIHAAFLRRGGRELLTINHFGRVRRFELPPRAVRLQPAGELQMWGDVERVVLAGDCFICSSPRGEYTADPARSGLFLFEPVPESFAWTSDPVSRLASEQVLDDWGVVSALAVSAAGTRVAVAAGPRLGVFDLTAGPAGLRLGVCRWESALSFHCQWIQFDEIGRLWAAGYRPSAAGSDDWDACRGGALHVANAGTGAREFGVELPDTTAWGYGADPIVPASNWRHVHVLGRDASLHVVDVHSRATRQTHRSRDTDPAMPLLGIGHAAMRDRSIYAGFSRGGFRLWRYDLDASS